MIQSNMYVLAVQDLDEAATYYRDILGFKVIEIGDDGWRLFERDSCRIMAGHCPDAIPASELGDHSYFAYLIVDDVDALHDEIVENGAKVTKQITTEPWGMREFGICTNDGHRIMIGQDTD